MAEQLEGIPMLRLVDKLTVRTRLWVLLGAGALGLFLLLVLALQEERALLLQDRQAKTRDLTETACGLLEHFHKLAGEGKLSEAEAQRMAREAVCALRYGQKEYFWIHDLASISSCIP